MNFISFENGKLPDACLETLRAECEKSEMKNGTVIVGWAPEMDGVFFLAWHGESAKAAAMTVWRHTMRSKEEAVQVAVQFIDRWKSIQDGKVSVSGEHSAPLLED